MKLLKHLLHLLFGYDIFISYSRSESSSYAAALANRLAENDFTCYLDQWEVPRGSGLPSPIRRALDRSSMLVLVATPGALVSRYVAQEFTRFHDSGRPIIPIDVDGALEGEQAKSEIWVHLAGVYCALESTSSMKNAEPGELVLKHIKSSVSFTKRNKKVRRTFGVLAVLLLGLFTATSFSVYESNRQTKLANKAQELAAENAEKAKQEQINSEIARDQALAEKKRAEGQTQAARSQRLALIAESLGLTDGDPQLPLLLAYHAWDTIQESAPPEIKRTLFSCLVRTGGRQFPSSERSRTLQSVQLVRILGEDRWLVVAGETKDSQKIICSWDLNNIDSPVPPKSVVLNKSEYVMAIATSNSYLIVTHDPEHNRFRLWDSKNLAATPRNVGPLPGKVIASHDARPISLSANGQWLAAAFENGLWVWPLSKTSASGFPHHLYSGGIRRVALDPQGKWLFASAHNGYVGPAYLWQITTDKNKSKPVFREILTPELYVDFAAFSPNGRWLVTAREEGYGKTMLMFWDLKDVRLTKPTAEKQIRGDFHPNVCVFSADGKWFFTGYTFLGGTNLLWRLEKAPELVASLPGDSIDCVSFDSKSKSLVLEGAVRVSLTNAVAKTEELKLGFLGSPFVLSRSGRWLLLERHSQTSGSSQRVLWDLNEPQRRAEVLKFGGSPVPSIRGDFGLSGFKEKYFRRESGDLNWLFSGHSASASFFIGNDRWLLSLTRDHDELLKVHVLPLTEDKFLQEARMILNRNLTPAEWATYLPYKEYRKIFDRFP